MRALSWHGRFLIVGFAAGIPSVPLSLPLVRGSELIGVFWGEWMRVDVEGFRAATGRLIEMLTQGRIDPLICTQMPLVQAAAGLAAASDRANRGKIIITV